MLHEHCKDEQASSWRIQLQMEEAITIGDRNLGIGGPLRTRSATCKIDKLSRILWRSHGHDISAAGFGFIEALVRDFEQFLGC